MPDRKADLHIHTKMSDGTNTLPEIVALAEKRNILTIAVTDHDTVAAFAKPFDCGRVRVIKGIELSTWQGKTSVHVLGYHIDTESDILLSTLKSLREERRDRGFRILENLERLEGISLDSTAISEKSPNASIGRMDIAREMVRRRIVRTPSEAFDRYIGDDCPSYVSTRKLTVHEACELIKSAKGFPVLAHPGVIKDFDDYDTLIDEGLEGIEVFYPKHSREQREFFHELAQRRNLVITGGSDFHGTSTPGRNKLGAAYMSQLYLDRFNEYQKERNGNVT